VTPRLLVAARISNQPCDLRFSGAIAQLEEHLLCKQGVRGSSPLSSTASTRENFQSVPCGHLMPFEQWLEEHQGDDGDQGDDEAED
jgi:hypothetical protein